MTIDLLKMNRAERRAQAKAKTAPPARHKPLKVHPLIRESQAFWPLQMFLQQLRDTGHCDYHKNTAVFRATDDPDGTWFAAAPAIAGWADLWDRIAQQHGLQIDTTPFRRIANKLELMSPILRPELDKAIALMQECRKHFRHVPRDDIFSAVQTQQIVIELDALGIRKES